MRVLRESSEDARLRREPGGEGFPPLILAGPRGDALVCLEGHLRLTAHALVGFPADVECLVGTARTLAGWAH